MIMHNANIALGVLGILLDFMVYHTMRTNEKISYSEDGMLIFFILGNLGICFTDFISSILQAYPSPGTAGLIYINHGFNFITTCVTAYLWLLYSVQRV